MWGHDTEIRYAFLVAARGGGRSHMTGLRPVGLAIRRGCPRGVARIRIPAAGTATHGEPVGLLPREPHVVPCCAFTVAETALPAWALPPPGNGQPGFSPVSQMRRAISRSLMLWS